MRKVLELSTNDWYTSSNPYFVTVNFKKLNKYLKHKLFVILTAVMEGRLPTFVERKESSGAHPRYSHVDVYLKTVDVKEDSYKFSEVSIVRIHASGGNEWEVIIDICYPECIIITPVGRWNMEWVSEILLFVATAVMQS